MSAAPVPIRAKGKISHLRCLACDMFIAVERWSFHLAGHPGARRALPAGKPFLPALRTEARGALDQMRRSALLKLRIYRSAGKWYGLCYVIELGGLQRQIGAAAVGVLIQRGLIEVIKVAGNGEIYYQAVS